MESNKATSLQEFINTLQDLQDYINNAKRIPFTATCTVNAQQVTDMANRLYDSAPDVVRQAQAVLLRERSILDEARAQAQKMEADAAALVVQKRVEAERLEKEINERAKRDSEARIAEANALAQSIQAEAERQMREKVSQENILRVARVEAEELRASTEQELAQLHDNVFNYLDDVMAEIDRQMQKSYQTMAGVMGEMRQERQALHDHRVTIGQDHRPQGGMQP
ncbi:MAG: ATP synthase F0 subunit B [Clostridiales bacterium]|nr:ATP synthase F0 subunit B [Clostridiales bacterium]